MFTFSCNIFVMHIQDNIFFCKITQENESKKQHTPNIYYIGCKRHIYTHRDRATILYSFFYIHIKYCHGQTLLFWDKK